MATTANTRNWLPAVNVTLLVPSLALIGAEAWYLATQAESVVIPLIWMAPMNLFLLLYTVEESIALWEMASILFLARFVLLPFLLLARLGNLLVFYALFMAPVDLLILYYTVRRAGRRVANSAAT